MTLRLASRHAAFGTASQPPAAPRNAAPQSRALHASSVRNVADHYATLNITPTASAADIKKQFYKLSKTHHPDHNPHDSQAASQKFMAISEAYNILGDPAKREKYDRESGRTRGSASSSSSYSSAGSYSPGGRKASGLSKRKSQFRGPPPSFYRNGAWGNASEKREANMGRDARHHEAWRRQQQTEQQSRSGAGSASGSGSGSGSSSGAAAGTGTAPGTAAGSAWPFGADLNDVSHFDRDGHYRTQTSVQDQLRKGRIKRRAVPQSRQNDAESGDQSSDVGRFFWVVGLFGVSALLVPLYTAHG